jgi:predicted phage terminase large subunit-like protein
MTDLSSISVSEPELVREICQQSFFRFVQEFWSVIIPEIPIWNWHIPYLCDLFQEDAERVFAGLPKKYDLTIINIPPGTTKSTILSICAPAWIHTRMPTARILCASHTQQLTFDLARKCRLLEESEQYQASFPEIIPSHDQWTKGMFINTKGGGRLAATVGGMSPTGFHAHFHFVDDPIDPQQASRMTETELETANNFMTEVLPSRKVDKETTVSWLIMQRLHQNDPSGYMLNKKGVRIRHICLPATRSSKIKPVSLRKMYDSEGLLDPIRLSQKVLDEARNTMGEYGYASQYDQNPVPRGGGMFKTYRIGIDVPPPLTSKQWVGLCRGWDKAGTKGGGAFTVGFLMGRWRPAGAPVDGSEDDWWILDIQREQLDSGEREKLIRNIAERDGKRCIVGIEQEPGSGGKESAERTVKRLVGFRTRVIPAIGSKETRADEWSTLVNQGCFKMKSAIWNDTLLDEIKYFPYSKYKDQVDAGSVAFAVLSDPIKKVGAL